MEIRKEKGQKKGYDRLDNQTESNGSCISSNIKE